MKYILSHPRLTRSANPLAQKLSELVGEKIQVKTDLDRNMTLRGGVVGPLQNQCIIRYGNSRFADTIGNTEYNSVAIIMMAGNKRGLSQHLLHRDFPHVEYHREIPEKFPIVARDELNRGGGIGIRIIENQKEYENGESVLDWTPWYNFKFELGVHILGGSIVRVFKKVRSEGLEAEEYPIKNTHRGYDFSLRNNWKDRYTGLERFVKKLYEIIPIQFARLDIGYDRDTGGYRLIEINSAPDLSQNQNTLNLYAGFLKERIFGV